MSNNNKVVTRYTGWKLLLAWAGILAVNIAGLVAINRGYHIVMPYVMSFLTW
jgi:hypothetical protein